MSTKTLQPQTIRNECLCLHVRRAARAAARIYDDALSPSGLTNGQFSVLLLVAGNALISMGELSEALGMDRTTVVAALKPLTARALLEVGVNPQDRRGRTITLTDEGRLALQAALPLWQAAQSLLTRRVGAADVERLREDLVAMAA
jgi:DNA-binding MarR family transcriptional regulator